MKPHAKIAIAYSVLAGFASVAFALVMVYGAFVDNTNGEACKYVEHGQGNITLYGASCDLQFGYLAALYFGMLIYIGRWLVIPVAMYLLVMAAVISVRYIKRPIS